MDFKRVLSTKNRIKNNKIKVIDFLKWTLNLFFNLHAQECNMDCIKNLSNLLISFKSINPCFGTSINNFTIYIF